MDGTNMQLASLHLCDLATIGRGGAVSREAFPVSSNCGTRSCGNFATTAELKSDSPCLDGDYSFQLVSQANRRWAYSKFPRWAAVHRNH